MLEGHGDDLYLIKGAIKANFSSNVFPGGCAPGLIESLQNGVNRINNYPSPIANELNELAAKHYGLPTTGFLFTNGATEAFYLIAHCFKGKRAAIVAPTFSEYQDACAVHDIEVSLISAEQVDDVIADLVFICNPNNPDGKVWAHEQLLRLVQSKKQTHFVIDEAYIEFTNATKTVMSQVCEYQNLTVVRSLTKTFAIPGLRLGYIVSNASFIEKLKVNKMPWSVNTMAIEAGVFIFKNYETLRFDLENLLQKKARLSEQIDALEAFECLPSDTSYFLVKLKKGKAAILKQFLIDNYQILVRDATNFKRLNGEFIRLAVQNDEQNEQLINALKEWQ